MLLYKQTLLGKEWGDVNVFNSVNWIGVLHYREERRATKSRYYSSDETLMSWDCAYALTLW